MKFKEIIKKCNKVPKFFTALTEFRFDFFPDPYNFTIWVNYHSPYFVSKHTPTSKIKYFFNLLDIIKIYNPLNFFPYLTLMLLGYLFLISNKKIFEIRLGFKDYQIIWIAIDFLKTPITTTYYRNYFNLIYSIPYLAIFESLKFSKQ